MTPFELKVLRKSLGLSQQQAADLLDVNHITYWRYENEGEQSRISAKQLIKLKNKGVVCPNCGFVHKGA